MKTFLLPLALLMLWSLPVAADTEPHRCATDRLAVGGYDLVSYREASGPQPGSADIEIEHGGLRYRFASADNRDRFLAAPNTYLPRYRGWCAATLSMGRLVCPDYTNFKIEDGDLLFFELVGFTNGRTLWDSDPTGFRQRADSNAVELLP